MTTIPKWTEVYPHGTKEGDEEMAFFISLARSKWDWRSTASLVKETGLTQERVEEMLSKYLNYKPPLVYMSDSKEDHWAYWQRVPHLAKKKVSLGQKDKEDRISGHLDQCFSTQVYYVQDDNPLP